MLLQSVHNLPPALSPAESWLLHAGLGGFLVAGLMAVVALIWPKRLSMMPAHLGALLSSLVLWVYFVLRFADGVDPFANAFEVLILTTLTFVSVYLVSLLMKPFGMIGAWLYPIATLIMITALTLGTSGGPGTVQDARREALISSPWLLAHIALMVVSLALFSFAAVISMIYLLQDRTLRRHRDSAILRSLPPLDSLYRAISRTTGVGLPLLTASIVLGLVSMEGEFAGWLTNPFVISSLVMWLVFLLAALVRPVFGLSGRRAVWLVIIGFALVFVTFFGTGQMPGHHSFDVEKRTSQPSDRPPANEGP